MNRLLLCLLLCCPAALRAEDGLTEQVITNSAENRNLAEFSQSHADFPQLKTGPWSVHKLRLHGGRQEGTELLVLNNGALELAVCPTRGMSVLYVLPLEQKNLKLGWKSPVQEIVHPAYIDLESRSGLGWLEGFNEWMCRCGLEFAGHPGKDVFTTNTGDRGELTLTLHGKIGNIPASRVSFAIDEQPPHRLRIRGTVSERCFFGPKLKLETEISTLPGSSSVEVRDIVTNEGADEQEFQLIYHTNYGAPLLGENARVVAAFSKLQPMNAHAAKFLENWPVYQAPTRGFIEQVYLGWPIADDKGQGAILLQSADGSRGASITWKLEQLPYLTIWKNTAATADGYVTGLEPATGFPFNRRVERHFGRVPKLKPGESRIFELSFGVHPSTESVDKVRESIEALQQQQPLEIIAIPPELPATPN